MVAWLNYIANRPFPQQENPPVIVALTANAFESGMNEHLSKPIDIAKLQQTLIAILRK